MTTSFHRSLKTTIKSRVALCAFLLAIAALSAIPARAQTNIFSENFSSVAKDTSVTNAAGWKSRLGDYNEVILLNDYGIPNINGATKALRMWQIGGGAGDVISPWINFTLAVYSGKPVSFSFDFFNAQDDVPPGDTSLILGFVSAMSRPYGITTWVAGQGVGAPHPLNVPYGEWTHVDLDITSDLANWQTSDGFGLLDWQGRGFNDGSVFLTNFKVTILPEPSTWMLFSAGLAVVGIVGWRRCRRASYGTSCTR